MGNAVHLANDFLYGVASNAGVNYNYGVYGRLAGSNAGAAVVGYNDKDLT